MATCVVCGRWAGIGKTRHEVDCVPSARPATETDQLIERLTPIILRAGARAGVAAALTFIAAAVLAGIIRAAFF